MNRKTLYSLFSLIVVFIMLLGACAPATEQAEAPVKSEQPATEPEEPSATEEPSPEEPATSTTDRKGGWLDEIVFTEENSAEAAVTQLLADEIDIYAYNVADPQVFQTVKDNPDLDYSLAGGSFDAVMFNVHGPTFDDGRLNPFSVPAVREAMNWLINRDYVVQEIVGGLGLPQYTIIATNFPDYTRYVDVMRELEAYYAYSMEKADAAITAEMEALGAQKVDGKWTFNGEPVTLVFVIRVEDERRQIGDYVSNQLEELGFIVDRQYKTRTEASPIWYSSQPAEGQWHLYTAGWVSTLISRDDGIQFNDYFTPRGDTGPLWQAYQPSEEFDALSLKLQANDFVTLKERDELFRKILPLSMQESTEAYVITLQSFTPRQSDVSVTYDLAAGVAAAMVYPYTLRFADQEGGTMRVSQPGIMVDPWNPIAGSNWVYDSMPQRATSDHGVMFDPYTGLTWPQRIEKAEVFVKEGLPVTKTLDWVDLSFEPEIALPEDTWVDWDATEQRFITAAEMYPDGVTANVKTVVYYPADLYETVKWHDGSPISPADFVMQMIMAFDPGKPESPIYDEAYVGTLEGFLSHFGGVRVVSTDPLVIETYDDKASLDAELFFPDGITWPGAYTWWPQYNFGESPWHTIAAGILAETNRELAFSTDKAGALEVEWMSFIAGPSLEILSKYTDQAATEGYIPFEATLGEFITADEVAARWENLQDWYAKQNHFWVGTGPYYLDGVFPVEGTLTLKYNPDYSDAADKWARFTEPLIALLELDGPGQVKAGDEAVFDVFATFKGEPYPNDQVDQVKYLLFNANGELVQSGTAEVAGDGYYQVTLDTTGFETGANKLEVALVSKAASIPSFASIEFLTIP